MRDKDRIRERATGGMEPRVMGFLVVFVLGALGLAFGAGYYLAMRGAEPEQEVEVPALASLDNLAEKRGGSSAPDADAPFTFHDELTRRDEKTPGKAKRAVFRTAAPAAETTDEGNDPAAVGSTGPSVLDLLASLTEFGRSAPTSTAAPERGPEDDLDETGPAPVTAEPIAAAEPDPEMTRPLWHLAPPPVPVAAPLDPAPGPAATLDEPRSWAAAPAGIEMADPMVPYDPVVALAAPPLSSPSASASDSDSALGSGSGFASPKERRFTVQVGSYPLKEEADALQAELAARGYVPYLVAADVPGRGRWYRVRIGNFARRDEALALKIEIDRFAAEPSFVTAR